MPAAPIIAGVGLATAAVGTAKTISAQNKAAKAQRRQYAYERQMNQNRSVRERRDAIRAARIAGANLVQNSENAGTTTSSAALGGYGSIQSQINEKLSFLDTQSSLADKAGAAGQAANAAKVNAGNWAAISNLGMAVFSSSDDIVRKFG